MAEALPGRGTEGDTTAGGVCVSGAAGADMYDHS